MDRALASAIAHRWHPIAAPLDDGNVALLLDRLQVPGAGRVLDLGCGLGHWLCAALERAATATGVGVDTSAPALAQAWATAAERRVADRVTWQQGEAASWTGDPADAVLCVGATHAFGGLGPALDAVRRHLVPGGRALLGEGFWESPPTARALAALGAEPDELPGIGALLATVREHGFEPGFGHISTAAEWDRYEWSWTGALTAWAVDEADGADSEEALRLADAHRREWLEGYRGRLGFVTVVLHDRRG
ncbi:SAM-dependent methyltransferase [Geodermatophilus sp. SYSU D00815]